MKEFDEIENLFSSAFDGAEMTPPPSVKEAVDASLFNNPKGGGFFWGYSILLIALISGVFIAYHVTSIDLETGVEAATLQSNSLDLSDNYDSNKLALSDVSMNREQSQQTKYMDELSSKDNLANVIEKSVDNYSQVESSLQKEEKNEIKSQKNSDTETSVVLVAKNVDNKLHIGGESKGDKSDFSRNSLYAKDDLGSIVEFESGNDSFVKKNRVSANEIGNVDEVHPSEVLFIKKSETITGVEISQLDYLEKASFDLIPLIDRDTLMHIDQGGPMIFKTPNKWSMMIYAGGQGAFNTVQSNSINSTYRVQEFGGIDFALEADYIVSRRFSLGGGIDFTQRKTKLRDAYSVTDSIISGGQWVIDNPSQPDSLQDSTFFATYDVTTTESVFESLTRQTSIGIPLYVSYTIPLNNRLNFRVSAGARLSYESFNVNYEDAQLPSSTLSRFGVNAMLRPELMYSSNRFGLGVYGKMTYDFKHGINWETINRKRYGIGGGVVLRFKL